MHPADGLRERSDELVVADIEHSETLEQPNL